MIFLKKYWKPDGMLIVCGSLWPGAYDGAPPPEGYPDRWRSDQLERRGPSSAEPKEGTDA